MKFTLSFWFVFLIFDFSFAQKVEVGTNIINNSELPVNVVETNMINSKNQAGFGQLYRHSQTAGYELGPSVNDKVSIRFEVADGDLPGVIYWHEAVGYDSDVYNNKNVDYLTYLNTGCSAYKGANGTDAIGTWRLPTQRELMIIYLLNNNLKNKLDINKIYWSCTETNFDAFHYNSYEGIWSMSFENGYISEYRKTCSARCIRDL